MPVPLYLVNYVDKDQIQVSLFGVGLSMLFQIENNGVGLTAQFSGTREELEKFGQNIALCGRIADL